MKKISDYHTCSKCGETFPLTTEFFHRSNKARSGFCSQCKRCSNAQRKEYYQTHKEQIKTYYSKYKEENREKYLEDKRKDYLKHKEKRLEQNRVYRQSHKEDISKRKKQYYDAHKEEIAKHGKEYREANKEAISQKRKEQYSANKEKILERQKKYREENRDKVLLRKKEEYQRHKEKYKSLSKKYKQENKDHMNEYYRGYYKQRKANDPLYKLSVQVRGTIQDSFRHRGYRKDTHSAVITGLCSKDLTEYLLQTFRETYGFEWDGKEPVHIDHIIPLATAKTEEDVIRLCHYSNLQLLTAHDNLAKGSKYAEVQV